jgi:hypothetical protein
MAIVWHKQNATARSAEFIQMANEPRPSFFDVQWGGGPIKTFSIYYMRAFRSTGDCRIVSVRPISHTGRQDAKSDINLSHEVIPGVQGTIANIENRSTDHYALVTVVVKYNNGHYDYFAHPHFVLAPTQKFRFLGPESDMGGRAVEIHAATFDNDTITVPEIQAVM